MTILRTGPCSLPSRDRINTAESAANLVVPAFRNGRTCAGASTSRRSQIIGDDVSRGHVEQTISR